MSAVRVDVGWEDIVSGRRWKATSCPIAKATRRALGVRGGIQVCQNEISYQTASEGEVFTREAPREVRNFVSSFDCRLFVEPFSFELDVPIGVMPPPPVKPVSEPAALMERAVGGAE